jgi:hypothetical protein
MNAPPTGSPKTRWIEPAVAVLMSLATLSTAWSSYQSAAWTRRSNRLMNEANWLERRAALLDVQGSQALAMHAAVFMQIIGAQHAGNQKLADFYAQRLAPDAKRAYEAWLAQNPSENPTADPHPFVPGLYEMRGAAEAAQARAGAMQRVDESRNAGNLSGLFLANTVLFAAVLFFAAMSAKFEQRRVRLVTIIFAVVLFGFVAVRTVLLPIPSAAGSVTHERSLSPQPPPGRARP